MFRTQGLIFGKAVVQVYTVMVWYGLHASV